MAPFASGLVRLLKLAATHPDGPLPLFEGHLESVAALYQVHPETVLHLRACLECEQSRASAAKILLAAARGPARGRAGGGPWAWCVGVLARAGEHPDLLELLTHGPVEAAAVLLQTHPFVIDEIRQHQLNGPHLRSGWE
jgi:hypothetical protein